MKQEKYITSDHVVDALANLPFGKSHHNQYECRASV